MRLPLSFLLLALAFAPRTPAFAHGGSDAGHSGGGGTFLRCEDADSKQIFYMFWDIRNACPASRVEKPGDRIRISREGRRVGGEWIDIRKLKSYRLMEKQIKAWARWAPQFSAVMQESLRRELDVIFTPYSIQSLKEIQVAPGFGDADVVPGAYFDYNTSHLYVDLNVWNRAGLESQAAMLLHEFLRRIQNRYQLKNAQIQHAVPRVILFDPSWSWADMLRYEFLSCYLIDDSAFIPSRAPGAAELTSPAARPSAEGAVREALLKGILGQSEVVVKPKTNGQFEVPERKPNPKHEIEILGTCLEGRREEDY